MLVVTNNETRLTNNPFMWFTWAQTYAIVLGAGQEFVLGVGGEAIPAIPCWEMKGASFYGSFPPPPSNWAHISLQSLAELALHKISLARDNFRSRNEEEKISSSSVRHRLLGTLLRPPQVRNILLITFASVR